MYNLTEGIDYDHDSGPHGKSITLDSGMTNYNYSVHIYDNDTHAFERNETFAICIRREMLMNQIVTFVEPTTAIITIVDNEDSKCLSNEEFYQSIRFALNTVAI